MENSSILRSILISLASTERELMTLRSHVMALAVVTIKRDGVQAQAQLAEEQAAILESSIFDASRLTIQQLEKAISMLPEDAPNPQSLN